VLVGAGDVVDGEGEEVDVDGEGDGVIEALELG
jgi:hypothetical protein